jgi:hypothetical protein
MSDSLILEPIGPAFACFCDEQMRSACYGEPFFKEHAGNRYCVLHFPGREKSASFKQALQKKLNDENFDFRGVWFPDDVRIQTDFEFGKNADFSSATFNAVADFRSARFRCSAKFDDASFLALALFNSAHFGGSTSFDGASFVDYANFDQVTFDEKASFLASKFKSGANFLHAAFNGDADFTGIKLAGISYFRSVRFFKDVDFKHARFDATNFRNASFGGSAKFENSVFRSDADFFSATFSALVNFYSVSFIGSSNFRRAAFSALTSFDRSTFTGAAYFSHASFGNEAVFTEVTFSSAASFGGTSFATSADFSYAHFKDVAGFAEDPPQPVFGNNSFLDLQYSRVEKPGQLAFHSVTLRPYWFVNADARRFDFINVKWHWRRVDQEVTSLVDRRVLSPHSLLAIACRHLAVNAEENHRYEDASKFRYMAMEARRRETWRGFVPWRLSWWYWLASGYGERVLKAFLMLLGMLVLSALLYNHLGFARWEPRLSSESDLASVKRDDVGAPLKFSRALTYSLGVMTLQKPEPRPATTAAQTVVLLETIFGPVQAALLALAIRRKFMR